MCVLVVVVIAVVLLVFVVGVVAAGVVAVVFVAVRGGGGLRTAQGPVKRPSLFKSQRGQHSFPSPTVRAVHPVLCRLPPPSLLRPSWPWASWRTSESEMPRQGAGLSGLPAGPRPRTLLHGRCGTARVASTRTVWTRC